MDDGRDHLHSGLKPKLPRDVIYTSRGSQPMAACRSLHPRPVTVSLGKGRGLQDRGQHRTSLRLMANPCNPSFSPGVNASHEEPRQPMLFV